MKNLLLRTLLGTNLTYYLWGSVIFLIIYFLAVIKFANKKLKVKGKLFVYTLPFTLLFIVYLSMFFSASVNALYTSLYSNNINAINGILNNAVTNYNPSLVQGQIGDVFNSSVANINAFGFSNGLLWFLLSIVIYFACLALVFTIVLKPIKSIQKNLQVLASGGEIKNFNLKGKDFAPISQNIIKAQNNNLSLINELARMRADFNKVLPKQAVQLLGKKDLSEIMAGNYVQKQANVMNIYFNFDENLDDLTKLTKVNKYFSLISPTLRNFNGVVFNYNTQKTQCLFVNKTAMHNAVSALNNINFENPEINIVPETKPVTIAVVGYNKQYTLQLIE